MGLSHGNNTAALPPMLLGDFETAKQAQSAVMAFQPHPPQLAEHLARQCWPNPVSLCPVGVSSIIVSKHHLKKGGPYA
ncbi:MAG TPA: hypothetical protein DCY46_07500 [Lactobacillus sp.]|nr:hypothetical protein [Lactobacillus sp.]